MNWWLVLGLLLVPIVTGVLYVFFVVRPRSSTQVVASVQLLVDQTHGRRPDVIVPATCEAITAPHKADLVGLGALATTSQGVFFAAANPDRVLIVPRADVVSAMVATSAQSLNGPVTKLLPMLVLRWRHADEVLEAGFATRDPGALAQSLNPSTPNVEQPPTDV